METTSAERVKGGPGRRKGSGKRAGEGASWGLRALQALADPSRYRIVEALAARPRILGDLARQVGLSAPCTSHHISILKEMGFVETVREARMLHCSLVRGGTRAGQMLDLILADLYLPNVSNRHSTVSAPELEPTPNRSKRIEEFLF
jgi:DNA-binding transcriptional ArsR family regulator